MLSYPEEPAPPEASHFSTPGTLLRTCQNQPFSPDLVGQKACSFILVPIDEMYIFMEPCQLCATDLSHHSPDAGKQRPELRRRVVFYSLTRTTRFFAPGYRNPVSLSFLTGRPASLR